MGLLDGKKALITGARKGIGRGIALTLANEGADVGVNDIVDDETSQRAVELIEKRGVKGSFHAGDVSTVAGINSVIDSFLETHGQIDILVNNAIFPDQSRPLFDTDEAYWDRMMDLSLKGYFFGSQRAAKEMIAQGSGGSIVCLSSVHSYVAIEEWTAYGTAKAGLKRMVKGFAIDLKGHNINANCIAPGAISNVLPTEDDDDVIDGAPHDASRFTDRLPAAKGGLPSDIANAVLYLTSELGQYVNGETILVDGGMIATKVMDN
ncbi:MAG: SDR family oxidoreductase [Chloroflexi bacterium]|jgi:NAD(P)-dependent dehydrogenase (short-subunit alcohol dehydrogenase family)|nr:SDR family oxidoreductase [Chloroflexota bacterium]MBT5628108.1 SDR family oxidoreductase [Chloroflexota bacterium]